MVTNHLGDFGYHRRILKHVGPVPIGHFSLGCSDKRLSTRGGQGVLRLGAGETKRAKNPIGMSACLVSTPPSGVPSS